MTVRDASLGHAPARNLPVRKGPVTAGRQRRTRMIYAAMVIAGLVPTLIGSTPAWQAAGLGLWLPGAGFFAVGGWAVLLMPVALALFVLALVAWFWAHFYH